MEIPRDNVVRCAYGGGLLLTAGIFLLDLFSPSGVVVWVLYLLPLLLTFISPRRHDPLYFSAAITVLIWIGFLEQRSGMAAPYEALNRLLGLSLMWGIVLGMLQYKMTRQGLIQPEMGRERAMKDLTLAHAERAQAESAKAAAVEARAYAETAVLGAVAGQRRAEEAMLEDKLRLDGIVQSAMDAIITVDEDQHIVLFNQAAERMFERPADEMLGRSLDRLIPERFRSAHGEHIRRFGRSGVTTRQMGALGMITGVRAGGEEFPIEAAISQVGTEGKRYFTVVLRDITDRKQAEAAMRHSEERYRRLVQVSPDAILVLRGDRVVFSNGEGLRLLGATQDSQILGRPLPDFIRPDDHAAAQQRIYQITEGQEQVPLFEQTFVKLDGVTVDVEVTAARYSDQEGPAILVVARAITERKRLQEQLRRTERVAELGTVASGMAHEIGTPMNVILGRAEYLMERTKEEPVRKGLHTIVSQVERITRVMNQLLAFARRRPIERRALDLRQTIEDNLEIFQERLAHNRIAVDTSFADASLVVYADADQMSQVLINLVMNAIHAMPDGGVLRLALTSDQGMAKLTASDTGHGMTREVIARIFDPFFTTKDFGQGTGLGLTVVKGIIEEHNGVIHVDSEPGKGTIFTICLPIHKS